MALFKRSGGPVDWLVVGLGNPGPRYAGTRHNVGFLVCERLVEQYQLGKPKRKFAGLFSDGRIGDAKAAVLMPQTFMNESGKSVGPARGSLRVEPDRIVVVHDEIDLPFGRIEARLGGGLAGHNGLKSLKTQLATPDFWRIRIGVGRPDTTDPEIVSAHVLGRFSEPKAQVNNLINDGVRAVVKLLDGDHAADS